MPAFSAVRFQERTFILDAGHGGEDGGAVAYSGTPESGINLDITLKLDQYCGLFGIRTKLLRDSDRSLGDDGAATVRERKRSDLMNRVKMISETENGVLISIHQNNYPDKRSKGAQVFCRDDSESVAWGEYTQSLFVSKIDPDNNRVSKIISKDVYIMNHIDCPALLVECGFLSNPEENALLESQPYQRKIAAVLLCACTAYHQ